MDNGGGTNLLIHEGKKADDAFLQNGTLPDTTSKDNAEFIIVLTSSSAYSRPARWMSGTRLRNGARG